ncbi:MAG: A24 family peptidase [Lachnospiraceae bacterium]|nr:A24 family peptidase [Lachnospiraceae bacterium]
MDIHLVRNVANLIFLSILSFQDIKEKKISSMIVFGYLILGISYSLSNYSGRETLISLMFGLFLLAFCIFTKEGIGLGDVLVILSIGAWNGFFDSIYIFFTALIIFDFFVLIMIVSSKIRKKKNILSKEVPFIPFVLIGMVVILVGR